MQNKYTKFEKGLIFINVLLGIVFLCVGKDFSTIPILSFFASIGNTICVILVAKRKISNYLWGTLGIVAYGIVSFYYGNTGEWTLNFLYYLPMNFLGWYLWKNQVKITQTELELEEEVPSKKLSINCAILVYSLTAIGVLTFAFLISLPTLQMWFYGRVYGFGFIKYLVDSLSTVLSVTAMILMVKCYREQWVLWIIVNVASIILWCFTFDPMMILLWSTLLANSIYGYKKWRI